MKRRRFVGAILSGLVASHFDLRTRRDERPISMDTYEIRTCRAPEGHNVASLTMPVFDDLDQAERALGPEVALKLLNHAWKIECQMAARKEMLYDNV